MSERGGAFASGLDVGADHSFELYWQRERRGKVGEERRGSGPGSPNSTLKRVLLSKRSQQEGRNGGRAVGGEDERTFEELSLLLYPALSAGSHDALFHYINRFVYVLY